MCADDQGWDSGGPLRLGAGASTAWQLWSEGVCQGAAWLEFVHWTDSRSDSSCAATGLVTLGESPLCLSLSTCRTGLTESTSGLSSGLNETICIKKAEHSP